MAILVGDLAESAWSKLKRPAKYEVKTEPRAKPAEVKQPIVEARGFKDIRLLEEWVAEMDYRPVACRHAYRMVIVRKKLLVSEPRQGQLFERYEYFFYITNDTSLTTEQVVFSANDRCNQENKVAQLKALRALHAPVDNLTSNAAYMLITSLAWNLKAWMALRLPETGRWKERHQEQKRNQERSLCP